MRKFSFAASTLLVLCLGILFFSCQKDVSSGGSITPVTNGADLTTTTTASVTGFITNENNLPVQGATVKAGNKTVVTNQYGYFKIDNATIVKNAAVVTVTKTGYFNGIKTYAVSEGKPAFFRIKLIPATVSGNFNAGAGGSVVLPNGLSVTLPANAVVNAATNAAYSGTVNVSSFFLDPLSSDLDNIMPGDQRGIDNTGALKGLTTYGMAAVELRGASGEKLQIASGKKATLSFPLSGNVLAAAPASIPLWYLDETSGIWKQDGSATKTGNTYIGDVTHFTFWNCDLPNAIVPLTFNVVNAAGNPLANVHVEITPTTPNSWSHIGGYTDATGLVAVFVTPNTSYHLVLDNNMYGCNTPAYTQDFSVTTVAVDLGNLVISSSANMYAITGNITDCSNNPLSTATVFIEYTGNNYYMAVPVSATGTFSMSYISCNTQPINIVASNTVTNDQSPVTPFSVVSGTNNLGTIQACGSTNYQYVRYYYDGVVHSFVEPGGSVGDYESGNQSRISAYISNQTTFDYMDFRYINTTVAAGGTAPLIGLSLTNVPDSVVLNSGSLVNFTEYGNTGGYISGNFAVSGHGYNVPSVTHNITCDFRVKRN